jgi:hypothetical protein
MLKEIEQVHGPLPDILLRQGIAEIGLGRSSRIPSLTYDLPVQSLDDPGRFFDEINRRLDLAGLDAIQRRNYNRLAAYAAWRNRLIDQGMDPGQIVLAQADEGLDLQFIVDSLSEGKRIESVTGLDDVAFVYVQDSPGLNNLNWNASPQRALEQVISGDLGEVVALSASDIARFNPTTVYVGTSQGTRLNFQASDAWLAAMLAGTTVNSMLEECPPDQPECAVQQTIYVVYARP